MLVEECEEFPRESVADELVTHCWTRTETLNHKRLSVHVLLCGLVSSLLIRITPLLTESCVGTLSLCCCFCCPAFVRDKAIVKNILSLVRSRQTQIILSLIFSK